MLKPPEFTESAWTALEPLVAALPPGGVLLISVERLPTENTPRVRWGAFDADARKRLKRALAREAKRHASAT